MPVDALLSSLVVRDERVCRRTLSAGRLLSAVVENVEATVASVGIVAAAGMAAFAEAPPASEDSGTGTVVAPGTGLGMATASLDEKLVPLDGALVAGGPGGTGGAPADVPPPPPQAARTARPRTAAPTTEVRFTLPTSVRTKVPRTCGPSQSYPRPGRGMRSRVPRGSDLADVLGVQHAVHADLK